MVSLLFVLMIDLAAFWSYVVSFFYSELIVVELTFVVFDPTYILIVANVLLLLMMMR